ncbi:hypothetical protein P4H11_33325, partial [Bacillus cereus]|nr:hypothetical protein [Bacillus cereus]
MVQEYIELNHLKYKLTENSLRFLVEKNIIRVEYKNEKVFIHREDLNKHMQWERKFSKEYFTTKQFWAYVGLKNL